MSDAHERAGYERALSKAAEAIESWKGWHREIVGILGLSVVTRETTIDAIGKMQARAAKGVVVIEGIVSRFGNIVADDGMERMLVTHLRDETKLAMRGLAGKRIRLVAEEVIDDATLP